MSKSVKTYTLNLGNSTTSEIGAVLRCEAGSREEALEKMTGAIPDYLESPYPFGEDDDVKIVVYFGDTFSHLTVEDVKEELPYDASRRLGKLQHALADLEEERGKLLYDLRKVEDEVYGPELKELDCV